MNNQFLSTIAVVGFMLGSASQINAMDAGVFSFVDVDEQQKGLQRERLIEKCVAREIVYADDSKVDADGEWRRIMVAAQDDTLKLSYNFMRCGIGLQQTELSSQPMLRPHDDEAPEVYNERIDAQMQKFLATYRPLFMSHMKGGRAMLLKNADLIGNHYQVITIKERCFIDSYLNPQTKKLLKPNDKLYRSLYVSREMRKENRAIGETIRASSLLKVISLPSMHEGETPEAYEERLMNFRFSLVAEYSAYLPNITQVIM